MSRFYVSCHDPVEAEKVAEQVRALGHEVVSDWHKPPPAPKTAPEDLDPCWAASKAAGNLETILTADALILIAGPDKYAGGKFIEAGFAEGSMLPVYVLGRVENLMAYAFDRFDTVEALIAYHEM